MSDIHLHFGDLPDSVDLGDTIAVDTETLGLNPLRDRLCLVQLSSGDGNAHLVKFDGKNWDAPNLKRMLADSKRLKILQYARFDIAVIEQYLGVVMAPVYCTKIASRLTRTYTDRHGLQVLCRELLDVDISKQQQSSDWAAEELSQAQLSYAASDVLYLHRLKEKLDHFLAREGRTAVAQKCFEFLPTRSKLDLMGWEDEDIFSHA